MAVALVAIMNLDHQNLEAVVDDGKLWRKIGEMTGEGEAVVAVEVVGVGVELVDMVAVAVMIGPTVVGIG